METNILTREDGMESAIADRLITADETAQRIFGGAVSGRTVLHWAAIGRIPVTKIGRKRLFDEQQIRSHLQARHTARATAQATKSMKGKAK